MCVCVCVSHGVSVHVRACVRVCMCVQGDGGLLVLFPNRKDLADCGGQLILESWLGGLGYLDHIAPLSLYS